MTRINTCDLSYQSSKRFAPVVASLTPFSGTWDRWKAAHLLRRATYGPRIDEIDTAHKDGLDRTLDRILTSVTPPSPPIKFRDDDDPYVALFDTWVDKNCKGANRYRNASLRGWYFNHLMESTRALSTYDRMNFFWLNYFSLSGINEDPREQYKHLRLIQQNALGNLRTMLRKITVEPRMLRCLNGDVNSRENPNENFARELMELFTLGKGELVGPGDYTTFTEQDVVALAKSLTGWKNKPFAFSHEDIPVESYFDPEDHDTSDKQLSHRFNNAVIKNAGADEYKVVIELLLERGDTAKHFCREVYRYFVFHDINPDIEQQIIAPLARTLIDNNFEIKPVLRQLFRSQHFYEMMHNGAIIKNPIDFVCSILRPFREFHYAEPLKDTRLRYELGGKYSLYLVDLGMDFLDPPTISGWKAYYDSPQYYRYWISPALLQRRVQISTEIIDGYFHINGTPIDVDWLSFIRRLNNPLDINKMLDEIVLVFFPRPLSDTQMAVLKESILGGLDAAEWTMSCSDYLSDPNNREFSRPIHHRMRRLFIDLFALGEFQLQ